MVSVKNGDAHIASLRDRSNYLDGRLIRDHTNHPAFRNTVCSAARLYNSQATTEHFDRMTFVRPSRRADGLFDLSYRVGDLGE